MSSSTAWRMRAPPSTLMKRWLTLAWRTARPSVTASGEYVRGQAHTNGVESFWAVLKRGYYGTYHKMSPKHLNRYVKEFAGRHNIRNLDTIKQMTAIARGLDRKRLPYADLTA